MSVRHRSFALMATVLVALGCGSPVDPGIPITPTKPTDPIVVPTPPQRDQLVYSSSSREIWLDDGEVSPRKLTFTGLSTSLSPSRDTVYYVAPGSCGDATLFAGNIKTGESWELNGGPLCLLAIGVRSPIPSPDGKRVSFLASVPGESRFSLFEMGVDRSGLRKARERATPEAAVYSPNGKLFMTIQEWNGVGSDAKLIAAVIEFDPATGGERKLWTDIAPSADATSVFPQTYDVSPDNKWVSAIAFRNRLGLIIRTDGSEEMRSVTPPASAVWFSDDGSRVHYVPRTNPNEERSVNLQGQDDQQVTVRMGGMLNPRPYRPGTESVNTK